MCVPPALSHVLDQTFHLLATVLLCPAAGALSRSLSLSRTRRVFPLLPATQDEIYTHRILTDSHARTHTRIYVNHPSHSMQSDSCRLSCSKPEGPKPAMGGHKHRHTHLFPHTHTHTLSQYPIQPSPSSDSDATSLSLGSGDEEPNLHRKGRYELWVLC